MVFYRILIILNCSVKTIFAIKPFFLSPKTPFLPRKISNHFTGVSIPAFPPERKPYGPEAEYGEAAKLDPAYPAVLTLPNRCFETACKDSRSETMLQNLSCQAK
jgi:hypothetical protein